MGHTVAQWQDKVEGLVRDEANVDVSAAQVLAAGIRPALAQYSIDHPREVVAEAAGAGSAYLDLPAGWVADFSRLLAVEHPARQDPPRVLDSQSWRLVRSVADVDVEQILLDREPAATEYYRLTFTAPWPEPGADADDDPINDVAFEAVAALAGAFLCNGLLAESARARRGAVPTQVVTGDERTRNLETAARRLEQVYGRFIGLVTGAGDNTGGAPAGSASGPAFGTLDYDPSYGSLFHGGRA